MTAKKTKGNPRIGEALLELARDFRGTLLGTVTADKITKRIMGDNAPAKPTSRLSLTDGIAGSRPLHRDPLPCAP